MAKGWHSRDTGSWGWYSEGHACDREEYEEECAQQNPREQDWPFTPVDLSDADQAKRAEEL
eukprot:10508221-Karenia_brevis.AAC.1